VNRFGPRSPRRLEQPFLVEVALGCGTGPNQVRLVSRADMQRATVGLRVDGHGFDSELPQGAEDAYRDLTAVGDQDFGEDSHG